MIIEEAVKLSTQKTQTSPLSRPLCVVDHCQKKKGHYRLASWVSNAGFLTWVLPGSQCLPPRLLFLLEARYQPEKTANKILRGTDTCSRSKVEYCYWEKQWLCWEIEFWSTEDDLRFDVWYLSCIGNYSCTKEKDISFFIYPYIYIYIERERERDRIRHLKTHNGCYTV